jgi:hypothetical protein
MILRRVFFYEHESILPRRNKEGSDLDETSWKDKQRNYRAAGVKISPKLKHG